jgi:hypothetical protein
MLREKFDKLTPEAKMLHCRSGGTVTDAPGFQGEAPRFIADGRERLRAADAAANTPAAKAMKLAAEGRHDEAAAACKTRAERWGVFKANSELGSRLWPDTGEEFAATVRMFGEPDTW